MKLAMVRRPATTADDVTGGPTLTVVGKPAEIVPWPGEPAARPAPVAAELRTKVFSGNDVTQEDYSAVVHAGGRSVAAILAALADSCAAVEDFGRGLGADDHLVLTIQIRV